MFKLIRKGIYIAQKFSESSKLPKANEKIDAREVRLIDDEGNMVGVVPIREALMMAKSKGLDLVEVSPGAEPPVCKILDFGKYKFQLQKKSHENKKKQKVVQIKEIKLRPNIDEHDYQVKLRSVFKFIAEGDKVKVTLKFRGREFAHNEIGMEVVQRMKADSTEVAKPELEPRMDGKQIIMVLTPK